MKKIAVVLVCSFISCVMFAQATRGDGHDYWEKMKSMKIAFITSEVGITPAEAQVFWPVYNEVEAEMRAAQGKVFKAYMAMKDAIKDGKTEAEVRQALHSYVEATNNRDKLITSSLARYEKVLPEVKVAKLYLAEEKFRRDQIRRLNCKPEAKKP